MNLVLKILVLSILFLSCNSTKHSGDYAEANLVSHVEINKVISFAEFVLNQKEVKDLKISQNYTDYLVSKEAYEFLQQFREVHISLESLKLKNTSVNRAGDGVYRFLAKYRRQEHKCEVRITWTINEGFTGLEVGKWKKDKEELEKVKL